MTKPSQLFAAGQRFGLVDAVDRLLDKGAVVVGDATVSLAGVDLIYLKLALVLASAERLSGGAETGTKRLGPGASGPGLLRPDSVARSDEGNASLTPGSLSPGPHEAIAPNLTALREHLSEKQRMLGAGESESPDHQAPDEARDLARLVLTLVDLLRKVLERQALHRMEGGSVSDEDTERMGLALMELEAKLDSLCAAFALRREDLEIDLGPLGKVD